MKNRIFKLDSINNKKRIYDTEEIETEPKKTEQLIHRFLLNNKYKEETVEVTRKKSSIEK